MNFCSDTVGNLLHGDLYKLYLVKGFGVCSREEEREAEI